MALTSIYYVKRNARIGEITIDASVSETHTMTATVTTHPVERGSDITDNVYKNPDAISMTGVISDTPIGVSPGDGTRKPKPGPGLTRAQAGYEELKRIVDDREVITIFTTLREYENMVLSNFVVNRAATTANAIHFSVDATQIRLVESKIVKAPRPKKGRGKNTKNKGKQPADQPVENQKSRSVLQALAGAIAG